MTRPRHNDKDPFDLAETAYRSVAPSHETRAHYRIGRLGGSSLDVCIKTKDGRQATGECADMSIAGAAVVVPRTKDLDLAVGASVQVTIQHMSHAKHIQTQAKVTSVTQVSGGVRYSLSFDDLAAVTQQVDSFFARWLNRRRHLRVMPDFSTKVAGSVRWSDGEIKARVHDVSMGGVGILVTIEEAERLQGKDRMDLQLTLPGSPAPIACRARLLAIRRFTKNALLGFVFEPGGGIERYAVLLRRYVEQRAEEIARYNGKPGQQPRQAG